MKSEDEARMKKTLTKIIYLVFFIGILMVSLDAIGYEMLKVNLLWTVMGIFMGMYVGFEMCKKMRIGLAVQMELDKRESLAK